MTTIPLTEAKKNLPKLVREVAEQGKVYSLTRRGRPAAVIMSEEDYQSIKETLEVLGDREEAKGIRRGRKDIAAGRVVDLEDLLERLQG
jgi:prevent-host-death family protein